MSENNRPSVEKPNPTTTWEQAFWHVVHEQDLRREIEQRIESLLNPS
ncbi:hypothetical protein H6G17_18255 [Chroococcidiopsis sp. FACHB-1243]|nr:hypothetical protein [Chroococcidiopsis sp. [FACHB-1243]]MBD2307420.1 hypothetical protein [Chroococcidiopsis sp. [FACHB-1243]]